MPRRTYRYSQSRGGYQESSSGEYDADHEKITTYSQDSKTKKWVLDINGKYNKAGKPVETYKYCAAEREYRRHVGGIYDKNGKELSNLTAGVNSQRSAASRTSSGPSTSSSRTRTETRPPSIPSASGSGSRSRTEARNVPAADNSAGHTLTTAEIERQNLDDAMNAELYNNDEAPPSYRPRGHVEIDRNNPLYVAQGVRGNQPVPGYTQNAPSVPKPTNQTYALGRGNAPAMETFGGRHNPNLPLEYSSGDAKGRRGNNLSSSSEAGYSSQDVFNMSGLSEGLSSSDNAEKKLHKGSSSKRQTDKEKEKEKKAIREGKKPAVSAEKRHKQMPSSGSSSFADSEYSPPKPSRVGVSGRDGGRSERHHTEASSGKKRETSQQRADRKRKEADAAAAAKKGHRAHNSSNEDLYRLSD